MTLELKKILDQQWYLQATPARPFFITQVAGLAFMQRGAGFAYRYILGVLKDDYTDWSYIQSDLNECADWMLSELDQKEHFLHELRKRYNADVARFFDVMTPALSDLTVLSDEQLFALFQTVTGNYGATVGTAHVLEAFSLRLENELRQLLKRKAPAAQVNAFFVTLTTPSEPSFALTKDRALWQIKHAVGADQEKQIAQFISDFYWSHSSYYGSHEWTILEVKEAAAHLESFSEPDFEQIHRQKKELIHRLSFSPVEQKWVEWTDFCTSWQDERKVNILKGIFACYRLAVELSRRFDIALDDLAYVNPFEISLEKLRTPSKLVAISKRRKKGAAYLIYADRIEILEGNDFLQVQQMRPTQDVFDSISGQTASLGTATGPVKICTTLASIEKVREGDILVASMTRPEYVPAMRRAAAIVTDEGGVTCHAAIVSRELGKPCIIGTKMATKALKDGWIVEVNANHGQVVVLEKGEVA